MVTQSTNLGRSGTFDFLYQRFSAIVLLVYLVLVAGFIVCNPGMSFETWQAFFAPTWMRVFSSLTLLSIVVHAWTGLWSVTTDYLTARVLGSKATAVRLTAQAGYSLILFYYLVWGLQIVWGN